MNVDNVTVYLCIINSNENQFEKFNFLVIYEYFNLKKIQ